jgi:TPR repeat protein
LAQNRIGDAYLAGVGIAEDHAEAATWYKKAAEQGNSEAQYKLALLVDPGDGVTRDGAGAVELIRKAASQGNADAKKRLDDITTMLGKIKSALTKVSDQGKSVSNAGDKKKLDEIAAISILFSIKCRATAMSRPGFLMTPMNFGVCRLLPTDA